MGDKTKQPKGGINKLIIWLCQTAPPTHYTRCTTVGDFRSSLCLFSEACQTFFNLFLPPPPLSLPLNSSHAQAFLSPPSGVRRATSTPSRSPSTAWATTARTWRSGPPTWSSTTQPRRRTAGPAAPPGAWPKVAAWAASTTSRGAPSCASSALQVSNSQIASGGRGGLEGAYLLLTAAAEGWIGSCTPRAGW